MEDDPGWQAALFHQRGGRRRPEHRRPVGPVAKHRQRRTDLSCAMIITDANAFTQPIHNRMPVLLDRRIRALADRHRGHRGAPSAPEDRLRMWPVSRRVNRTGGGDDPASLALRAAERTLCATAVGGRNLAGYIGPGYLITFSAVVNSRADRPMLPSTFQPAREQHGEWNWGAALMGGTDGN